MSKRVANTRACTARNRRIRIGWKRARQITKLREFLIKVEVTDATLAYKFQEAKRLLIKVIPKRLMRRTQAR